MGTGASKPSRGSIRKAVKSNPESDTFHAICRRVFELADVNHDGILDKDEFFDVLRSDSLSLNLSDEEMEQIYNLADNDHDGSVTYTEFIPAFKHMLQDLYQDREEDWNDWGMIRDDATGEVYYLNKRTGVVTPNRPENYREERVEIQSFEYFTLSNGVEVSTYVDDNGQRLYMDWDTQSWQPFDESLVLQEGESASVDYDDPRMGTFSHPQLGDVVTYIATEERHVRYYYDDSTGEWLRMPFQWECQLPDMKPIFTDLNEWFPHWDDATEQLLVLHDANYDVEMAAHLAQQNELGTGSKKGSVSDAQQIFNLEKQLAEKVKEIERIKEEQRENETTQKREFVREKTRVEDAAQRKERLAQEAQERIEELQELNGNLRSQVSNLQAELVAHQADADKITQLEAQVAAQDSQKERTAVKELTDKLEAMRMENVALKLKVQRFKDKQAQDGDMKLMVENLQRKTKSLHREYEETSAELQGNVEVLANMFANALTQSKALQANVTAQVEEIRAKYLKEQIQRKLLYNKVQELRGNIRVFLRVRYDKREKCTFKFPSETEIMVPKLQGGEELIEFEKCYSPSSKQEQVFTDTQPLIMSAVDGYNVCIMAYGQTGSGKTFTMMGPDNNPGVNKRAIKEMLDVCDAREEVDYTLTVSLLEVYNEKIFDLLSGDRTKSLKIHNGPNGTYVGDLTQKVVKTQDDVLVLMETGDKNRSQAATKMNTDSSRSHLILQIAIDGHNKLSKATTRGKLTLVDLAGSERVAKTEASGERLVEAAAINKSLSALGQVFKALGSNSPHVPYRNSKLTHVLQDSLGGDSKTAVFVNVSPLQSNLSETLMTMKFGQNIRKVELGPAKKNRGPPKRGASKGKFS